MESHMRLPQRAVVSPDADELPKIKKMHRAREWRAVDCSTDSSVSASTNMSEKVHPYVEIGKQLQELRTLVRQSCSADTIRASRVSGLSSHEFSHSFRPGQTNLDFYVKEGARESSDDHLYAIKVQQTHAVQDIPVHHSSATTPKRPPRYVVITPEDSLMEAISSQDARQSANEMRGDRVPLLNEAVSTEMYTTESGESSIHVQDIKAAHAVFISPAQSTPPMHASELYSSPETTVSEDRGSGYWKMVAKNAEQQLDKAERSYASKLMAINREHEDLEERQQQLLEELGDRLSVALRGEQFWKQTLKKVMAARKYIGDRPWTPTSGALTRSPDKAAEGEVGSAVDVMTNSVLQQELLSEGIDIPSSLFNWSVSSNGLGMDADVSTCSVTDYPHDKDTLTTLRDQLVCETKLRLATGAHVEMLKKQNAALVAGLSALIDPKNARKYRSTMRGLLSTSNQSRPYSSADNARYSQFIDSAFASNNADYSESLFSELAEFELRLNEQFDAKLRSLQNDVKAVDDRHAAALERERSSNAENIMKDRVTRSNKLKDKYRERLYNLNQSLRDRKASSSTDAYAYVSELQAQKKAELSAIRCRIEGDYSAAVSDLSKELQMKEQTFADERKNLSAELAAALRQQGDEYSDELKKSFESELLELEDKLRSVLDNHRSEMEKVRNKIEAESSTEKATLEAELKSVHIEVMQALQKEMFALNSRHQAMVADMTADHELAVEEEKLSIYYSLRRQCDQEIERIEADIHDAQCAFAVEIAKSECEAMQQKEEELAAKRASFLATAQLEIDIKNAELDSLGESHEKEMRALEEEHVRMAERVKAEVLISIERKHEAEKTALTTMLSSLQESLRAAIDDRKASLFATSAADIMTAMVKEDEMHVAHVKHINAQIASTYNRFGQEIKFAQSKHNIQLAALQDSYQADLETEYLSDMCRISDEIDLQNIRLEALVVEQPKQPKQHMVMVSFGTQTDGIDGEDCTTDDQLHAVGEDPLSHPPDYGEVLFAQMDELREAIQSEHRKEVELLKVKHSSELSSLETKLNAELNKVNSDFQTFTDNVQSDLQSVKLQLTDARRKEKLARADLQSMSYNGQQTVAALEAQLASLKLALTDQEELHSVEMNRLRSVVERHTTAYGASVEESVSQETEVKYLTDINARLQEHISNLEYVVEKKIVECDQLSLQVQSMFRLIEIYKGQYQETNVEMPSSIYHAEKVNLLRSSDHGLIKEERQVPIINYLMPKSVEHMRNNVVSISGSTVDIDGATYTCSDLVTALKKAVKQKNSAQSLCRQQQLCILALRLLVRTVENKYEEFKRNRKDI